MTKQNGAAESVRGHGAEGARGLIPLSARARPTHPTQTGLRREFTAQEDELLRLAHAGELRVEDVRESIGCGKTSYYRRMVELGLAPKPANSPAYFGHTSKPKAGITIRRCMAHDCVAEFQSTGPHHRLCPTHRQRGADLSPYEPDPGGHAGRLVRARRGE